ncbi:MAG: hypothetical protein B7Z67_04725 [Acidiphilium sp. 21-60-14]|nr:MAG: hypothetical protein B7Z67_04725 [Acidiphilium sp. 21-60-14]OYV90282.1 MAG: hypothetical protein B7Z57_09400 [Acidiphilium sp. 37-60-79]OZB38389.1 MAG: hypothetical protein B7X48_13320 [Acidiphilium sp. 34-60-192]
MVSFCVTEIKKSDGSALWHLDAPQIAILNRDMRGNFLELAGWVFHREDPAQSIVIYAPLLHRAPLAIVGLHQRADVTAAFDCPPDTPTGFRAFVNLLGLRDAGAIEVGAVPASRWAAFSQDSRFLAKNFISLARIDLTIRHDAAPVAGPAPIFVTSMGRSGSTALMGALAAHPAVLAPRSYPYESKLLQYAQHVLAMMVTPSTGSAGLDGAQFIDTPYLASTNPFLRRDDYPEIFDWFAEDALGFIAPMLDQTLTMIIAKQASEPQTVRFVAEKLVPNTMMASLAEAVWAEAREIILLRDFDDWLRSARGFSKASGRYFGRNAAQDTVMEQAVTEYEAFLDYAERRRGRAMIVPFDALMAGPAALEQVCARLDLTMTAAMEAALRTIPAGHANVQRHGRDAPSGLSDRFAARTRRLVAP